jgi:CheY-like chemotaxis protein
LIADPSAACRNALIDIVEGYGDGAEQATRADQVVPMLKAAKLAQQSFDVVVLGSNFSDAEGLAVAEAIRREALLKDIRCVLMVALIAHRDVRYVGRGDCHRVLVKPVRHSDIIELMQSLRMHSSAPPSQRQPVTAASMGPTRYRGRVLLAEDNLVNQMVAKAMLARLGVMVDTAVNGFQVLEALAQSSYDVVLMDVQMPELDGLETTARIRQSAPTAAVRDIPVIAMTANAMPGDREQCLEAGMNDYLSKPIVVHELASTLARWLPRA